jgi:hypothetical protein
MTRLLAAADDVRGAVSLVGGLISETVGMKSPSAPLRRSSQ